ncbi:MAG: hypothetical protein FWG61_08605 [Firmicutes bacterium]|nr:hypothetical protein [Bacillota bacterium]
MIDLRVNYSILDDILGTLSAYQKALSEMEDAIDTTTTTVLQSKGKGIHAIQTLSDNTKNGLITYKEQLGDLITIIGGFISDMTYYIMPESRGDEMRVNRDNIKWSIGKIEENFNKDVGKMNNALNKSPGIIRVTEDRASALQRNHSKLSGLHYDVSAFATGMNNIITDLWDLYNYRVNPYQECDEEFARKVKELYDSYSNWWEKFCDFWKSVGSSIADFFVGLFEALWGLIKGIFMLVFGLVKLVAGGLVFLVTAPFGAEPQWVKDMFSNIGATVSAIWNDPSLIWESLSHSISEAWDNKGAAYCIGYGFGLILPIIVTLGIGALGEGAEDAAIIAGLLEEGMTVEELVMLGVDVSTLIEIGVDITELLDLVSAGVISFRQLILAIPFQDLIYIVSFNEIVVYVPINEILFSISFVELVAIIPITEILSVISLTELVAAGVTLAELFTAGLVVADFIEAGFTINDILETIQALTKSLRPQEFLEELAQSGVKYTPEDVIAITKTSEGMLVWLEKGGSNAGLEHIMNHAGEFISKGIPTEKIPDFLIKAVSEGKVVGMQGTRPIYEVVYNGQLQRVAITIGENGYIVGANMR